MHTIEPFYNWKHLYEASRDVRSPFFQRQHSEFEFTNKIYNYLIHPQWEDIDSDTLFVKLLYADYENKFCIIEMLGEWNDAITNDIMHLKRGVIDPLLYHSINKFILIGENVLNFHGADDSYYEEWFNDVEDGWIALLNFRTHVLEEMKHYNLDYYLLYGGKLNLIPWRTFHPLKLFKQIDLFAIKRLA